MATVDYSQLPITFKYRYNTSVQKILTREYTYGYS